MATRYYFGEERASSARALTHDERRLLDARLRRSWSRMVSTISIAVLPLPLGLFLFQFEPFTRDPHSAVAALLVFIGVFSPGVALLKGRDRSREIKLIRSAGESPLLLSFDSMTENEEGDLEVEETWDVVFPPGYLFRVGEKVRPVFTPVVVRAASAVDEAPDGHVRWLSDDEVRELEEHIRAYSNLLRWEWLLIAWGVMGACSLIWGLADNSATRLIAVIMIVSSIWAGLGLVIRRGVAAQLRQALTFCAVKVDTHPDIDGVYEESLMPVNITWTSNGNPASWRLSE